MEELFLSGATSVARLVAAGVKRKDAVLFIESRRERISRHVPGVGRYSGACRPWEQVSLDIFFFARRPYLIAVDVFSGLIRATRIRSRKRRDVRAGLTSLFRGVDLLGALVFCDRESSWTPAHDGSDEWFHERRARQVFVQHAAHAERAIRTVRETWARTGRPDAEFSGALQGLLARYNDTPHSVTGVAPSVAVATTDLLTRYQVQVARRRGAQAAQESAPPLFAEGDVVRLVDLEPGPGVKRSARQQVRSVLSVLGDGHHPGQWCPWARLRHRLLPAVLQKDLRVRAVFGAQLLHRPGRAREGAQGQARGSSS